MIVAKGRAGGRHPQRGGVRGRADHGIDAIATPTISSGELEAAIRRDAVLVVCADGERSAEVAEQLRGDGVDATSLEGGLRGVDERAPADRAAPDEEYEGPPVKIPGAVESKGDPEDDEDEEGDEGTDEAEVDEEDEPRSSGTEDEERAERAEEA